MIEHDDDQSGFAPVRDGRVKRYSETEYSGRGRFGPREAADTASFGGLIAAAAAMAYGAELFADHIEGQGHEAVLFGGPVENFAAFAMGLRVFSLFMRSGGDNWFANATVQCWTAFTTLLKKFFRGAK